MDSIKKLVRVVVLVLCAGILFSFNGLSDQVLLEEDDQAIKVDNGIFKLSINKADGLITSLQMGEEVIIDRKNGILTAIFYNPLPRRYGGDAPGSILQQGQKVDVKVLEQNEERARIGINWDLELGTLKEDITVLAGKPFCKVGFEVELKGDIWAMAFAGLSPQFRHCVIYPNQKEYEKLGYHNGVSQLEPSAYVFISNPYKKLGLGIFVPQDADIDRLSVSPLKLYLDYQPNKNHYQGSFYLYLAKSFEENLSIRKEIDPASFKEIEILKVTSQKLFYKPGEEAKSNIILQNNSPSKQSVTLKAEIIKGLDTRTSVGEVKEELAPYEQKVSSILFNTGEGDGGREIEITAYKDNKTISTSSDVFLTASYWPRFFQWGAAYPDMENPDGSVDLYRENYVNTLHVYNWFPESNCLAPEEESWICFDLNQKRTKTGYIKFAQKCREEGVKSNFYYCMHAIMSTEYKKDPTLLAYNQYGQLLSGGYSKDGVSREEANVFDPRFRDWVSDQFIKSIAMFGWDSVMIDCITRLGVRRDGFAMFYSYDWQGNVAGEKMGPDANTAGENWINELKSRVRKVYPDFPFMANGTGPGDLLGSTGLGTKTYLGSEIMLGELGGGGASLIDLSTCGIWSYLAEKTINMQHRQREEMGLNKFPYYMYIPNPFGGEISTKLTTALCFANQAHLYTWWPSPSPDPFGKAMTEYYRFATRFAEYIYNDKTNHSNSEWVKPESVDFINVEDKDIQWKDYIYQEDKGKSKSFYIHLLNQPKSRHSWCIPASEGPVFKKDIKVTFRIPEGYRLNKGVLLSPDLPGYQKNLSFNTTLKEISFSIPEIKYYGLLYLEIVK